MKFRRRKYFDNIVLYLKSSMLGPITAFIYKKTKINDPNQIRYNKKSLVLIILFRFVFINHLIAS